MVDLMKVESSFRVHFVIDYGNLEAKKLDQLLQSVKCNYHLVIFFTFKGHRESLGPGIICSHHSWHFALRLCAFMTK